MIIAKYSQQDPSAFNQQINELIHIDWSRLDIIKPHIPKMEKPKSLLPWLFTQNDNQILQFNYNKNKK